MKCPCLRIKYGDVVLQVGSVNLVSSSHDVEHLVETAIFILRVATEEALILLALPQLLEEAGRIERLLHCRNAELVVHVLGRERHLQAASLHLLLQEVADLPTGARRHKKVGFSLAHTT